MEKRILSHIQLQKHNGIKQFAILIDPDKSKLSELEAIVQLGNTHRVNFFFVGGSLLVENKMEETISFIKQHSQIPVILFPGSIYQLSAQADALLLLSLISGRNPDLLIGKQVEAATKIKQSGIEYISTGYILIDGGKMSSVSYVSGTQAIPADKPEIAMCTALAGEMLGMQFIYLDAGSGALHPVSAKTIAMTAQHVSVPIIVGGGITTAEQAYFSLKAGADIIVVGNAIEKDPELIAEISDVIHTFHATNRAFNYL